MRFKSVILCALIFSTLPWAFGQPARRLAIMNANGPAARSNGGIALVESQLADNLTARLAGRPGITLVDRASIDQIIKEQNFQNSDRSSPDTAARIGKLLGVGQIVLVQVVDGSYTQHNETSGSTTQTIGTVVLRANARLIDVETAVILAEPTSSFQDEVSSARSPRLHVDQARDCARSAAACVWACFLRFRCAACSCRRLPAQAQSGRLQQLLDPSRSAG